MHFNEFVGVLYVFLLSNMTTFFIFLLIQKFFYFVVF